MGNPRGLFDLENHFAFYGAYHSNPINIFIHTLFVWPIFFTSLVLFYFTPTICDLSQSGILPSGFNHVLVFNYGFLFALIYGLFYVILDKKAGSLAALICLACWVGATFLAAHLGYSLAWKIPSCAFAEHDCSFPLIRNYVFSIQVVLAAQLFCWTGQFIGHGVFEKRAPALLDNLVQAFLMAPFFVLLEVLQSLFGYEPYPGFHARVKAKIEAEIKEWKDKKQKKNS
ncbi:putative endoplasmic reticulum membrane protein C16E8.02-like [Gossypium australe]|uniref:Putative endoplasmic reticulum membrane protein C16E8.02-like n=1 Tax=Gossypium australe TaxID=47621 RepID=A0A5B6UPE7_9ROSI|nr:putative endoplasmic reticulum membrane protein C16E8.02-like [Gossypium australe]